MVRHIVSWNFKPELDEAQRSKVREEVVARIRAILRRTREQVEDDPIIRVADLEINEDSHDVSRAGQPIDLSPTEYKLLRYLMDNEGRVLSKAQILDHVWQYDWGGDAQSSNRISRICARRSMASRSTMAKAASAR